MKPTELVGTWELIKYAMEVGGGPPVQPLGVDAVGWLIYAADGHMSVQIARAERPAFASPAYRTSSRLERATATDSYLAYAGPYELAADGRQVIHHAEVALFPNWMGRLSYLPLCRHR